MPKMAPSNLEVIPQEVIDVICENLDGSDLISLARCNANLKHCIQRVLYGTKSLRDQAITWACEQGATSTIRMAMLHGMPGVPACARYLEIAAGSRQGEAFKVLLELGASNHLCAMQLWNLIYYACISGNFTILRYLYDEPLDDKNRAIRRRVFGDLVPLIEAGAPMDILQDIIRDGADPNRRSHENLGLTRTAICPLSAAIFRGSKPLFLLLIEHGADIHGQRDEGKDSMLRSGLHIPVFAAARAMAVEEQGQTMMQLCLESGADINHVTPDFHYAPWFDHHRSNHSRRSVLPDEAYYLTTPLLAYLDAIKSWSLEAEINPVARLAWLLDHGVLPLPPSARPSPDVVEAWETDRVTGMHNLTMPVRGRKWMSTPTAIEFLIGKHGMRTIREPYFLATLILLVKRGVTIGRMPSSMPADNSPWQPPHEVHRPDGRTDHPIDELYDGMLFRAVLHDQPDAQFSWSLVDLLQSYARQALSWPAADVDNHYADLACVVRVFESVGANINPKIHSCHGKNPLFRACEEFSTVIYG
ncbi:hypothetical protein B0T19DRAFT_113290 [Cercophora scortea]|uniref:F-box domain-containing protein n=1 Tax=Cercophora scortea TaxID=314031 RepID=A0AAE0IX73_9PEZI|nr:hypothetical protein B0T19DRAFT_113290 [Cercophora scortea]